MKKNKEILSSINTELDKISTNSFSAIKTKVLASEKYVEHSIKKEGEEITPNEQVVIEDKPKHKFDWRIATIIPMGVCCAIAIPISIHFATQPVAPCEASVKTTFEDEDSSLSIRYELNGDAIDEATIKGTNELGRIFVAGLHLLDYDFNFDNVDAFLLDAKEFINEYGLLDNGFTCTLDIIHSDKNYNPNFLNADNLKLTFMGLKSDYANVIDSITIKDIKDRLIKFDTQDYFSYENLLKYAKNNGDLQNIKEYFIDIDRLIPEDEDVQCLSNMLLDKLLNNIKDTVIEDLTLEIETLINDYETDPNSNSLYECFISNEDTTSDEYWFNKWPGYKT